MAGVCFLNTNIVLKGHKQMLIFFNNTKRLNHRKVIFTTSTEIYMQETLMSLNSPRNLFHMRRRLEGLMVKHSVGM